MQNLEDQRRLLASVVRGTYALQRLRIATGLRIVSNFKEKIGQTSGTSEEALDREAKKLLLDLRASHQRLTDAILNLPRRHQFPGDGLITNETQFALVDQYLNLEAQEEAHFKSLKKLLSPYPLWHEFLKPTKGIGPAIAAVIISQIDITKATYPSSLWVYAGLGVCEDGRGKSRRKEHLVDQVYIDKDGNQKTRKGLGYNPFLKSKLVSVLGGSFIKSGKDHYYSKIYYNYKNRIEHMPAHADKSKGHRHKMAVRYMIKRFLVDLHIMWRHLEGLPLSEEYSIGKLGMKHSGDNNPLVAPILSEMRRTNSAS